MELILTLLIPVTFVLMLALERVWPARPLPKVKRWFGKGVLFFLISGFLNALIPAVVAGLVAPHAPVSLMGLGPVLAGVVGFVLVDLLSYGYHRLVHNQHFLWRWTHQMHHSAERLDIAGAVYFHPFDITSTIVVTTVGASLLGLSADAAALAGFLGFFYGMFQHLNLKTPVWLGYLIQRPEAHSVHHARGLHAYNYGNVPVWDLLFGTFRNPSGFNAEQGFWDGASARVGSMLMGRDVGDRPRSVEQAERSSRFEVGQV